MSQPLARRLVKLPLDYTLVTSEAEFKRLMRRLRKDAYPNGWMSAGAGATTHLLTAREDCEGGPADWRWCVVCIELDRKRSIQLTHAWLAHEAVHVWQEIREAMGEHNPSSEFEAYSVESICRDLFEAYDAALRKPRAQRAR